MYSEQEESSNLGGLQLGSRMGVKALSLRNPLLLGFETLSYSIGVLVFTVNALSYNDCRGKTHGKC